MPINGIAGAYFEQKALLPQEKIGYFNGYGWDKSMEWTACNKELFEVLIDAGIGTAIEATRIRPFYIVDVVMLFPCNEIELMYSSYCKQPCNETYSPILNKVILETSNALNRLDGLTKIKPIKAVSFIHLPNSKTLGGERKPNRDGENIRSDVIHSHSIVVTGFFDSGKNRVM